MEIQALSEKADNYIQYRTNQYFIAFFAQNLVKQNCQAQFHCV